MNHKMFTPYLSGPDATSPDRVRDYAQMFGVIFPETYVEMVSVNGGTVLRDDFNSHSFYNDIEESMVDWNVDILLHYSTDEDDVNHVMDTLNIIKNEVGGIIPFAQDLSTSFWCFDYRETREAPKIVFYDRENLYVTQEEDDEGVWSNTRPYFRSVFHAADSFDEFIAGLRPVRD